MKNVLFLSPTVDTAGLGIGLKRAFDQVAPGWTARHVRTANTYLDYGADIQWTRGNPEQDALVQALWSNADIVQIMERPEAAGWLRPRRRFVVYHLGTWYRRDPEGVGAQCRAIDATEMVDMHDLMRFGVREWLPDVIDPVPLEQLRARTYQPSERIRIAHAPTNRAIKSTAIIEATVARLAERYPIDFDLIERVSNAECLARKASADIFIDELTLGYGLNALECWSMGVPVVSGIANPETEARMRADFGGGLPFLDATADSLEETVAALLSDRNLREDWGALGRAHVERFHAPAAVIAKAIDIYTRAGA